MPIILRLIAAGVPAAKIIAKYGKKAYDVAKKQSKSIKNWHKDLTKGEKRFLHYGIPSTFGVLETTGILLHKKDKKKEKKEKRTETRKAQRGVKTYAKGSRVRKPKY